MSKPPRIRYFAGPATWALARDAYLGGEGAASIARRLGLTVNGLRKRAARHGWTRTQHARALARERRPDQVLSEMLARIGPALREGRLEEAADLARAAERLTRGPMPPNASCRRRPRRRPTRARPRTNVSRPIRHAGRLRSMNGPSTWPKPC